MKKTWKEMDWVTCEFCGGSPCMVLTNAEDGFANEDDDAKCPSCKATGTISCDGEGGADVNWDQTSVREPDLGEWLGQVGVKTMEDAAACYASLGECMKHHDEQSVVRKRHAAETYKAVEKLDYKTFDHPTMDYQDYRDWNLRQAAFDAGWGDRHKAWADSLRVILHHNAESIHGEKNA